MADQDHTHKKPRKSNFSSNEIDALIDTVKKHYAVLYGPQHKRGANKVARHRCWVDILRHVNQVSIEKRTLQEVKNKWKKCQYYYKSKDREYFAKFDSMPLEQRMASPADSSSQGSLKSQPISPTKLKVTRQVAKSQYNSQKQAPSQRQQKPPEPEEVCLRWNSHHSNMQAAFPSLLRREQYVDVTLVAEGKTIKCHRLILSSCSPYFEEVLNGVSPNQHPVFFMKDVPYWILKSLCDFMYAGEVHIYQNKLQDLLAVAEALRIKGLAGKCAESNPQSEVQPQFKSVRPTNFPSTLRKQEPEEEVDPLDLLEPVYEEITKPSTSGIKPVKEAKTVAAKKVIPRKIKKRKLSEESEDTFQSPGMVFPPRKGTRSRPNVKIPKYYHTIYDTSSPQSKSALIEHEPHRTLDPLIGVDDIKAEPFDPDDELIEIENNVVFADQGVGEEEIVAPPPEKINVPPHPVLLEKSSAGGGKMQIINLGKTDGGNPKMFDQKEDPLDTGLEIIDTANNKVVDPLILHSGDDDQMIISNICSVADDLNDKDSNVEEITGNDNVIHLTADVENEERLENVSSIENVENNIHLAAPIDNTVNCTKEFESTDDKVEDSQNIDETSELASEIIENSSLINTEDTMEISESNLEEFDESIQENSEINANVDNTEEAMEISETNVQQINENTDTNPNNSMDFIEASESSILNETRSNLLEKDTISNFNQEEGNINEENATPSEKANISIAETTNHAESPKSNEVNEDFSKNKEILNRDAENEPDLDAMTEKALLECTETNENDQDQDQDQEADLQNLLHSLDE